MVEADNATMETPADKAHKLPHREKTLQRESSLTVVDVFGGEQNTLPHLPEKPEFQAQRTSSIESKDSFPMRSSPSTDKTPIKVDIPAGMVTIDRQTSAISAKSSLSKTSVTFGAQRKLPRLPIPSLDETLNKFLQHLEALQDEEERQAAKEIVSEFMKGDGQKLQNILLEYDREGAESGELGSYVEEFWNESYLAPDSSVVLNLNPFFVLEDGPDPKIAKDPIRRAASLCFASVKMASMLKSENVKPDTFRGKPLCMDQFKALFSTARVPMRHSKDSINVYENSNHVAVMIKCQIYYFQVLWPDGDVAVDEGDLIDILSAIHSHACETNPVESARSALGVLTSLSRGEWALAREEMIQASPKNGESLQIVDSALFVLVLDDYIPKTEHDMAANMLHGSYELKTGDNYSDIQVGSCCNRWYDKLQIIVCGDGTAGINFEHSAIDGHTALRFVSDIYAETVISFAQSITKLVAAHDTIPNVINATVKRAALTLDDGGRTTLDVFPKRVAFELPDSVRARVRFAEAALGDQIVASETRVVEFKEYGKLFLVGNKLSPDSFVQMSMMLAYYKLYGRIVCAYEPVLTKTFFHGRTEAMRPATVEAKELCEVFCGASATPAEKLAALCNAARVHSSFVKDCLRGKGVDRHLFALKCIAERANFSLPPFFQSAPWKLLNHTVLSTSNCGNPALRLFGFGPVVADGLGIGYIIKDWSIHYSISSKHRQTQRYASTLESVLREMASLLKPLSSVHVPETRTGLKSIPHDMISYDLYGDIPPLPPTVTRRWTAEPNSVAISAAATRLAQLTPEMSGTDKITERWDEERQASEEIIIPVAAVPNESDCLSPVFVPPMAPLTKIKRQKSNDSSPVIPNRRGSTGEIPSTSMFSGFNRRSSFEYAELSRRGIAIDMQKCQATGEQSDEIEQSMAAMSIPDLPATQP